MNKCSELPESTPTKLPSEATMDDVLKAINDLKVELQSNSEIICQLSSASVAMQATLKKMENFITTNNQEIPLQKNNTSENTTHPQNNDISTVEDVGDIGGSAGKRKALLHNLTDDEINNVIISLTDDDEENGSKKICRPTVTPTMENTLNIMKPQLPASWTRSSAVDKGKSIEMSKLTPSKYKHPLATHKVPFTMPESLLIFTYSLESILFKDINDFKS